MTGFSPHWLALREPFDSAGRNAALARQFAAALPDRPLIVDLGAGTGSNLRYLAPLIGAAARFRLVDDDAVLLSGIAGGAGVETMQCDLVRGLPASVAGAAAITCAALMDLVSAAWFDQLAAIAAQRRTPLLLALSVDGRCVFSPADADDALVMGAFARDQGRSKGFGAALGAQAPAYMRARLAGQGARVQLAASDWRLEPGAPAMLRVFLDGLAEAAARAAPDEAARIADWLARRRTQIERWSLAVTVGHQDLLALW